MLKFSKQVRPGHLVVRSGDRYIRASCRSRRIVGIMQAGTVQRVLTDTGVVSAYFPRGIVIDGLPRILTARR